jgi:hypothetical protein
MDFLFIDGSLCSDFDVFEKSDQSETPFDNQKSAKPMWL